MSTIGTEGKHLNFSVASRALNMEPDAARIKQYDEYPAKSNPLKYFSIILSISMLVLTVYLFYSGHWTWGILSGVASFILIMLSVAFNKSILQKEIAYENGLLIPAIITSLNPLEITAMADMSSSEEQSPLFGLIRMQVAALPGHELNLSEKIPCVSLFGMAVRGYRRHFEPRPICWGFAAKELYEAAKTAIAEDVVTDTPILQNEWVLLEKVAPEMKNFPHGEVSFFDETGKMVSI